mmetsp:Transcript_74852/g.208119  ORF Transcript_74852/g.208119 Transcript_74852/m.208119 type:complete len:265 (+) Transcript_74852:209-1003(+)
MTLSALLSKRQAASIDAVTMRGTSTSSSDLVRSTSRRCWASLVWASNLFSASSTREVNSINSSVTRGAGSFTVYSLVKSKPYGGPIWILGSSCRMRSSNLARALWQASRQAPCSGPLFCARPAFTSHRATRATRAVASCFASWSLTVNAFSACALRVVTILTASVTSNTTCWSFDRFLPCGFIMSFAMFCAFDLGLSGSWRAMLSDKSSETSFIMASALDMAFVTGKTSAKPACSTSSLTIVNFLCASWTMWTICVPLQIRHLF